MAFNYSPKVVTDGLVLYLDAANPKSYTSGSTAWRDLTRNGNTGTLTNGPTFSSANGGNIVFDGVDDFVSTTYISNTFNNHTQTIWYKWNGINQLAGLIYLGNLTNSGMGLVIYNGSPSGGSGNQVGVLYGGLVFNAVPTTITLNSNSWNYMVVTRNDTTTKLYNNSNLVGSTTSTPNSAVSYQFNYGNITSFAAGGNVSNINFYNRELTEQEIKQNFNAIKGRFGL